MSCKWTNSISHFFPLSYLIKLLFIFFQFQLKLIDILNIVIANALQKIGFSKPVLKRVFIQEEVTEFGDIPRIRVGPATLKGEEIDNLFDAANELRWARSRMDEYQIAELEEEKSEQQLKFAEMVGIPKEHVDKVDHIDDYEVRSTWTELDYFERVTFVLPFYGLFVGTQ